MSLIGAASHWLRNKPSGSIKTWEYLKTKFLSKYCPPALTAKKMEEINNFQQEPDETLYQTWERFKELLMKCHQHYLIEMQEMILFYNGLDVPTRKILDSKGVIPSKIAADAKVAIQETRDQVDDLMPTIKEGEVIDEPMIDIIKTRNNEVVENMDGYQDQDMGDIILGEPFCKASCVEARMFDGLITIHNGSDNVTYQMTRPRPKFKHLSNVQCNKIKPLLKVSMYDKLNEVSHLY
ncbi:extracellular solute-binding protein 3 [Tanacetum coccineum]